MWQFGWPNDANGGTRNYWSGHNGNVRQRQEENWRLSSRLSLACNHRRDIDIRTSRPVNDHQFRLAPCRTSMWKSKRRLLIRFTDIVCFLPQPIFRPTDLSPRSRWWTLTCFMPDFEVEVHATLGELRKMKCPYFRCNIVYLLIYNFSTVVLIGFGSQIKL